MTKFFPTYRKPSRFQTLLIEKQILLEREKRKEICFPQRRLTKGCAFLEGIRKVVLQWAERTLLVSRRRCYRLWRYYLFYGDAILDGSLLKETYKVFQNPMGLGTYP
jgi:hypothetical protein